MIRNETRTRETSPQVVRLVSHFPPPDFGPGITSGLLVILSEGLYCSQLAG
jgi:hypothetical protein